MLERTHIPEAPWWVVEANDKKRARLNCIAHLRVSRSIDESFHCFNGSLMRITGPRFRKRCTCPTTPRTSRKSFRSPQCPLAVQDAASGDILKGGAPDLPDRMRVAVDPDIEISAKTVRELRKVTVWPDNLAITSPQERLPESAVRVSKANVATRTSPKP